MCTPVSVKRLLSVIVDRKILINPATDLYIARAVIDATWAERFDGRLQVRNPGITPQVDFK
jgi:hypothetical protein